MSMIGKTLGTFECTALLGKGGMGEVYKAKDQKLGRDVAIKVLPEEFAQDTDRVARFQREAKLLASLNHPNIASIYGLEESDGTHFLVLELIEGDTLENRLKRGAIPVEEALKLALQIAEALEEAHERGVIHRDLKPANIKVTPNGQVKVLDFGLAKAFAGDQEDMNLSNSPTLSQAATQQGVILGTAAYMSPEQARGKSVDKRSDIWSFGTVLYEMVTGKKLFEGEDLTETLASVVMKEPDLSGVPSKLRKVLQACLQKDPRERLQAVGDWKLLLDTGRAENQLQAEARPTVARLVPWGLAVLAIVAAIALWILWRSAPEEPSLQLNVALPEDVRLGYLEISPDGRHLLAVFFQGGNSSLWIRSLDSPDWQQLSNTEGARSPFWSPDSRFIGFFADGKLKKIPAIGGPTLDLCSETGIGDGGTWNSEGVILFASSDGKLRRADADGSKCSLMGDEDLDLQAQNPTFLPDGNSFLYVRSSLVDPASNGVYLSSLIDHEPHRILADRSSVVYVSATDGELAHLLFLRENTLMAQPFDEGRLEPLGDPFRIAAGASFSFSPSQVAASYANGTLVYLAGLPEASQFTWFNRAGEEIGTAGPQIEQKGVALSHDGNMALTIQQFFGVSPEMWLYDIVRDSEKRLSTQIWNMLWLSDGRRILSAGGGQEGSGLYLMDNTGGGQAKMVLKAEDDLFIIPSDFSNDGKYLICTIIDPQTRGDIWYLPWSDNPDWSDAVEFLQTGAVESQGQISPDGKWMAYTSDESGSNVVYIRSFPSGSNVKTVSVGTAFEPRWSADGDELFYLSPRTGQTSMPDASSLFAVNIQPDKNGGLRIGIPEKLFEIRTDKIIIEYNVWAYTPHPKDRQRFLVSKRTDRGLKTINVITNWRPATGE